MTDITIAIDTLPTLSDQSCWSTLQERMEKAYENGMYDIQQYCQRNMKWIILSIVIIGLIIGILVLLLTNKPTNYPCLAYSSDTLASSVSIACIQYMWTASCGTRAPYVFPANYVGWWNQAPEGATMVPCNGLKKGTACGVGSYSNMVTYSQYCNIRLNQ